MLPITPAKKKRPRKSKYYVYKNFSQIHLTVNVKIQNNYLGSN